VQLNFYTADVFTKEPFHGAQIAVFPDAGEINARQMHILARELNLSESVFLSANGSTENSWRARIFSPRAELDFGGHPTIAAAYVLAMIGAVKLKQEFTPLTLIQNTGPVHVHITEQDRLPDLVQFSIQTQYQSDKFVPTTEELGLILNLEPKEIGTRKFSPLLVSCGYPYLIVPLQSYQAVRRARFHFDAWTQTATFAREILLITKQTDQNEADFHGRLLGAEIGITEDPPIGSAMPALCGYLCAHPHIQKGTHCFTITRGEQTTRKSLLNVEMINHGTQELTLRVGGAAVLVSEGRIRVPESLS
jgi:trans-2,3-dihydro-3-hydroxyanthranilate isomerase